MSDAHHPPDGLSNPDVDYERSDVASRTAIGFAVALGVGIAVVMLALWGLFRVFFDQEAERKSSRYPIAEALREKTTEDDRLPPTGPRIEGFPRNHPQHSLGRFNPPSAQVKYAEDEEYLAGYGWLDDQHTVARIPIAEAIKRIVGTLPARKNPPPDESRKSFSNTNSGREPIGGPP